MNLEAAKENFLKKYNSEKSIEKAKSMTIGAALQHNTLYNSKAGFKEKRIVRSAFANQLSEISAQYKDQVSEKIYYSHVINLQNYVNDN